MYTNTQHTHTHVHIQRQIQELEFLLRGMYHMWTLHRQKMSADRWAVDSACVCAHVCVCVCVGVCVCVCACMCVSVYARVCGEVLPPFPVMPTDHTLQMGSEQHGEFVSVCVCVCV